MGAEKVYVLLITTKTSNILEDLETLRLFARVVPEYCRNMEETDIVENAFQIIFAFDEIVALGYRESVNLAQIRTFVEMDSHEEKVYQAVRQTQEREAKQKMREKAKELQRQKMEAAKRGGGMGGMGPDPTRSMGSSSGVYSGVSIFEEETRQRREIAEKAGLADRRANALQGELEEARALLDSADRGKKQADME